MIKSKKKRCLLYYDNKYRSNCKTVCLYALLLLLLMPASLPSQNNNTIRKSLSNKHFGTREGMAYSQATYMFQDSFGYIWITCLGSISRFDGIEFKNFFQEDIPDIQLNLTYINQYKDIVYVVSGSCVILFHPDLRIETFVIPDKSSIIPPYSNFFAPYMIIRIENSLYIFNCTNSNINNAEDKLFHYYCLDLETGTFKQSKYKIPLVGAALHNEGKLIVFSVLGNQVFRLENDDYSVIQELKSSNDHSIFYMTNGKILMEETIEDKSNIYLLSLQDDTIRQDLLIGQTEHMLLVSDIGDDEFLLQCKNNNKFFLKNGNKQEFTFNEVVYHTLKDCDGNLWLSTSIGIYNHFTRQFITYTLPEYNIWNVRKDTYGNIWFSCYGSGIWRVDTAGVITKASYISKDTGLKTEGSDVFGLSGSCEDPSKRIYLNSTNGLIVFDPKNGNNNQLTAISSYNTISSFYDSLTKKVYVSAQNSADISMLAVDSNMNISEFSDVSCTIFSICRDANNILRIGTVGEIFYYLDETQGLVLRDTTSRPYRSLYSMAVDSSGILWKGTESGLYAECRDGKDTLICVESTNGVAFVANYKEKYLIFGYMGIKILNLEKFHRENIIDIRSFSSPHGLELSGYTMGGYSIDSEGYVWLAGGGDMAVCFHPEQLMATPKMKTTPDSPYLATIYNKKKDDPNWRQSDKHSEITLENEDNSLRFDILSASISFPDKLQFRYRLNGYSKEWVYSTSRSVVFQNLPHGDYQLETEASVDGKEWSATTVSKTITIETPFWSSFWGIIIIIVMIIIVLVLLVYMTAIIIKKKEEEQRQINILKYRAVRSKYIPHFTGNILNSINYFVYKDKDLAQQYIAEFSDFTIQTLSNSEKTYRTLEEELNYTKTYLELEKLRFEDKLEFYFNIEPEINHKTPIPTMIMQTFCENALKHGLRHKEGIGIVEINVRTENHYIVLSVKDNGIGREKAKQMSTEGTGEGLVIIEQQLRIFNKKNKLKAYINVIDLHDNNGVASGTCFEFYLPKKYNIRD